MQTRKRLPAPRILFPALAVLLLAAFPALGQDEFPLRPFYPGVPSISTSELAEVYDSAVIIDIRTRFEFDVAHMTRAKRIPLADGQFRLGLKGLRGLNSAAPLVFYANGPTDSKVYEAVRKAMHMGFANVFAYDAGIFAWITTQPEHSYLLGKSPARPERMIPPRMFERRLLSREAFTERAALPDAVVIDIRSRYHREFEPRIPGLRNIPMSSLLEMIDSRIWMEKRLLFLDQNATEVRWLQYFLEANGYVDYAFLRNGVDGWPKDLRRRVQAEEARLTMNQHALAELAGNMLLDRTALRLLMRVLSRIRLENIAVAESSTLLAALEISPEALRAAAESLRREQALLYSTIGDTYIFEINPGLAWRGEMGGTIWKERATQFLNAVQRRR